MSKGILILSGKVLDDPRLNAQRLLSIRGKIANKLADEGVELTRCVLTVSPKRPEAMSLIDAAGFDFGVKLAEDEDLRAEAQILSCLAKKKVDEAVFLLADAAPTPFLKWLEGKVPKRTFVTLDDVSDEVRENVEQLHKIVDYLQETPTSSLAGEDDDANAETDAFQALDAPVGIQSVYPLAAEQDERESSPLSWEKVENSWDDWNPKIEKFVSENENKILAKDAFEMLDSDEKYHGFLQFFFDNLDDLFDLFQKGDVRLVEEESELWLVHTSHSDLRPVLPGSSPQLSTTVAAGSGVTKQLQASNVSHIAKTTTPLSIVKQNAWSNTKESIEKFLPCIRISQDESSWFLAYAISERKGWSTSSKTWTKRAAILERAKEHSLYLWQEKFINDVVRLSPIDFQQFEKIYKLLYQAFDLLNKLVDNWIKYIYRSPDELEAFQAIAHVCCMLKTELLRLDLDAKNDTIQTTAHFILKNIAEKQFNGSIHGLKLDDNVHYDQCDNLEKTLKAATSKIVKFSAIQDKLTNLETLRNTLNSQLADPLPLSNEIVDITTVLVRTYLVSASSSQLRKLIEPVVDLFPEDLVTTPEFEDVLDEIALWKMEQEQRVTLLPGRVQTVAPEVEKVRNYYQGAKAVFVGGVPNKTRATRLKDAFQFSEVVYEDHEHGESLTAFQKDLDDPDVRLFIVFLRSCGHRHSSSGGGRKKNLPELAKKHGKDLVRVAGTNPNTIAVEICQQIIDQREQGAADQ